MESERRARSLSDVESHQVSPVTAVAKHATIKLFTTGAGKEHNNDVRTSENFWCYSSLFHVPYYIPNYKIAGQEISAISCLEFRPGTEEKMYIFLDTMINFHCKTLQKED